MFFPDDLRTEEKSFKDLGSHQMVFRFYLKKLKLDQPWLPASGTKTFGGCLSVPDTPDTESCSLSPRCGSMGRVRDKSGQGELRALGSGKGSLQIVWGGKNWLRSRETQ